MQPAGLSLPSDMRTLLLLGLAAFSLPALAQTRIVPAPDAMTASGGRAGEAMRVTTYANRPAQADRLSQRYRGISVNRSPKTAMHGATAPTGFASGNVVMPSLRTPGGRFVRRGGSSFRVVRGHQF